VGPGRVLGGLVKKIHPDATVHNLGAPEDLDAISQHIHVRSVG
jgi:hypothetical protein